MTGWLFSSSATTEGTRFDPSSPGITTGLSPCMKATREFVVPRSMPTMRSVAMVANAELRSQNAEVTTTVASALLLLTSDLTFQHLTHIPNQVSDVVAAATRIRPVAGLPLAVFFHCGLIPLPA